jgi:pyruvate kinase
MISSLIDAGMNVARINFSHGTTDYARTLIRRIKRVRAKLKKPVAILQDLQGPKIRIGTIKDGPIELRPGQEFVLTADAVQGDAQRVGVSLKSLPEGVVAGETILLADGNIELRIGKVRPPDIVCRVVVGGALSSHKGINLPGSRIHVDALTRKDRKDVLIGLEEAVDAIALSFVRSAADILALRRIVNSHGAKTPIVAKIEKQEAVHNIDAIIDVSDAVMVARGDLGVEIDLDTVPLVQKSIIANCNARGKPVITATQMLARMVENPRPTRAEAADVANAVLDGTDAVMLSEETAVGRYPLEAVAMMDRIVHTAETRIDRRKFESLPAMTGTEHAITRACYAIAREVGAGAIVAPTWSGSTPSLIARCRPLQPIVAPTPNDTAFGFLSFCWGVIPIRVPHKAPLDRMIRLALKVARDAGFVESGGLAVVTASIPLGVAGRTNSIKVETVE